MNNRYGDTDIPLEKIREKAEEGFNTLKKLGFSNEKIQEYLKRFETIHNSDDSKHQLNFYFVYVDGFKIRNEKLCPFAKEIETFKLNSDGSLKEDWMERLISWGKEIEDYVSTVQLSILWLYQNEDIMNEILTKNGALV